MDIRLEDAESWLERVFYEYLALWERHGVKCESQVPVLGGKYRVDAVATSLDGRRVGLEADGAAYHGPDRYERDRDILTNGGCDEIIRIPYRAIVHFPESTLRVLHEWHEWLPCREPSWLYSIEQARRELHDVDWGRSRHVWWVWSGSSGGVGTWGDFSGERAVHIDRRYREHRFWNRNLKPRHMEVGW